MAGKKTGLFFGSFNPIHNGHLMIANYMAEFTDLDEVWFVISPQNPFKADSELLADYHRRELLMRAVGEYPKFRVSSVEFKLPKPSYTINTLGFLEESYPGKEFVLIMGSDQLPDFHRWKNAEQILLKYKILVYPRAAGSAEKKAECDQGNNPDELLAPYKSSITFVDAPMLEISSTFIRDSIKIGRDVRFFMPDLTWQYIEEMHFYR